MIAPATEQESKVVQISKSHHQFIKDNADKRMLFLYGGAGSAKSQTVALHLILERLYTEDDIRILVCRKTFPALRTSALQLILDKLNEIGLPYKYNESKQTIFNGPNEILFRSLDDVDKLKSIERINYIWIEEATQISEDDFKQLNLRCRGRNSNGINQLYFTFNPTDPNSWLKAITERPRKNMAVHHSTHLDNPFLPEEERQQIEDLVEIDEDFNKIYRQGLWAVLKNLIYSKYDVVDCLPDIEWEWHRFGLDFGFATSKCALMEIWASDGELWEQQHIYQTHLTTPEIIAKLKEIIPPDKRAEYDIIADSARPEDIQEIYDAGFNIYPCIKGQGSVEHGIDRVRRYMVHILSNSPDILEEKQGYKWKKDKNGNVLKAPVKFRNDLMDAERYGVAQGPTMGAPTVSSIDDVQETAQPPARHKEVDLEGGKEIDSVMVDRHRQELVTSDVGWR